MSCTYKNPSSIMKSIRLKGYDYAQPGAYFVTICTNNRCCIFGDIADGVMQQSRFYDHIIRDDKDFFFIEQYIRLNPLLWYLDTDDPNMRAMPPDELRKTLKEKHDLSGYALERMIEHEMNYRDWWEREKNLL